MSPRKQNAARELAKAGFPDFLKSRKKAIALDLWATGRHELPVQPRDAPADHALLAELAPTPWFGLAITSVTQACFVEDYRSSIPSEADIVGQSPKMLESRNPLWDRVWQPNGMDSRQSSLYRAAFGQGQAYMVHLPGTDPLTGQPTVKYLGYSMKKMLGFFTEENDEWMSHAIYAVPVNRDDDFDHHKQWAVRLYDEGYTHYLSCDDDGEENWQWISAERHGLEVPPVIRYPNQLDLDGVATGEVEPFIPLVKRIDQDTFDRLIVQRYGAWKVRFITGMDEPADGVEYSQEKRQAIARRFQIADILMLENPDAKAGTLAETQLDGFLRARDADIKDFAAVTQTPPHNLLGLADNLSAEALAAAEASLMRKVDERKHVFGERHEQGFRLDAWILGDVTGAKDFSSQVVWKDTESRSLAQAAAALGALATQLKVPPQMLWRRIPGWTSQDTEEALKIVESGAMEQFLASFMGGEEPSGVSGVGNEKRAAEKATRP
jgi:hypothetical protein